MACKNKCVLYEIKKGRFTKIYAKGVKRCTKCEVYINWDGVYCPCCNGHLRINARAGKGRRKRVAEAPRI